MHWFLVNNIHNISVKGEGAASNYAVDELADYYCIVVSASRLGLYRFGVTSAIMDVWQLRRCAINSFCLEHEQHEQPWRRVLGVTVLGATSGEGFSSPYKLLSHFYSAPHCKRCTS